MYFSSDGHDGFGSFDIYKVDLNESRLSLVNLGGDINSISDDFGFVINEKKNTGFFARSNSILKSEIYWFKENDSKIDVNDLDFDTDISFTDIVLVDDVNAEVRDEISVWEKRILSVPKVFSKEFELAHSVIQFPFNMNNSDVVDDIFTDELYTYLNNNSGIQINLNGYSDSRGDAGYNLKLSTQRAESVKSYLVNHGVAANRIFVKGNGENNLLNHCADGVECSDEEHAVNRRVEFDFIY